MIRLKTRFLVRTGVLLALLTVTSFAYMKYRRARSASELPTAPARKGDFLVIVRSRGELGARRSVQVTAPLDVPDLQIVWLSPPGGEVKAGQTIIKFDPSRGQQESKEKGAALDQAQASLDQAGAQARIAEEQDKLALATARYQVERARLEVSKQSIVSVMQGESSAIDLGLAEEKLKLQQTTAMLHNKSGEAKIASLQRLRDEARSEVLLTRHRLSLMELKSPLDGIVNYLPNYSQGWMNAQPFKVGDHAVPGGAVAEVPDLSTLQMESKVDEVDRGRIKPGDTVLVHVDAFPEKTVSATLVSITALTEQNFNEWPPTRSFKAYAQIQNPDVRMRPGMNAGADFVETKLANATSIPAKALFTVRGKPTVYLKSQGQYLATEVRVRARNPDEIAIDGIAAGSQVALAEPPPEKH